jgi:hypothetical protein
LKARRGSASRDQWTLRCAAGSPQTRFARDGIRFVISGIHRGARLKLGGHSGSRNPLFPESKRPRLAQTRIARDGTRDAATYRDQGTRHRRRVSTTSRIRCGFERIRDVPSRVPNATAIQPIDMEVNMAAIQSIWMAFVALSTVFAASLWATIIAEFWRARAKKADAAGRRFIDSRPL